MVVSQARQPTYFSLVPGEDIPEILGEDKRRHNLADAAIALHMAVQLTSGSAL
jgi:hypothetical protein